MKGNFLMKSNTGTPDRFGRVLFALVIGVLYLTNQISGLAAIILGLLAFVFLVTGLVGFCPLYLPFRFTTKKDDVIPQTNEASRP